MATTVYTASKSRGAQVLALLKGALKRPGPALLGKSEAGPGDSESA